MATNFKPHIEMAQVDLSGDWQPMAGLPGIEFKPLADNLDEQNRTGARSRLVRLAPGAFTTTAFTHSYWEEFFLLSGDMVELNGGNRHDANVYCCRPPGTPHGPFRSDGGCIALEMQYYPA